MLRTLSHTVFTEPEVHRRPSVRLLTSEERRALDVLNALGAVLAEGFTAAELRRQYRLLARRIHPDRHPHAAADERVRLSRAFAAATDSYRLLAASTFAH